MTNIENLFNPLTNKLKIIEAVWEKIADTKWKNDFDFSKFKNAHIDYEKQQIFLDNFIISIKESKL